MKRVRDIAYFKKIREIREYEFGLFYFFDGLVISEIHSGVTFNWNMAQKVVDAAHEFYGKNIPIAYISNRVNDYFVVPGDWAKFYRNRHKLSFYSVVGNTKGSFTSLVLERMFFQNSIKQFSDVEDAIDWSLTKIATQKELA
ncbi:hypothetical protein HME9304_01624 [Flagellimonas maritima]|uniref:STAS/SEC14 domain-containing protein n=1 Tax=Flagellimonas maritima TaxID=1383885 RepID=A0A2Z4LRT7_9FLAO|nr:hypothetical protein [Allomuricauda aurantiaca]AWX44621.1 hypothetical protein HME9304_01624 [Allomuricauda aurantiaca]